MKKIPDMIRGDWQPTPDPAGRYVECTLSCGTQVRGTVVAVEYAEDCEPMLYIDVTSPDEHRGEMGVRASRVTWLDVDQPPWAVSRSPSGRWVLFRDDDGVEHYGRILRINSCHRQDATLSVVVLQPDFFDVIEVSWRRVKWLPV
jgi:hypothetical protein